MKTTHSNLLSMPIVDPETETVIDEILLVIDTLLDLIDTENLELSRGMPAPLTATVIAKTRLSGELAGWVEAIQSGRVSLDGAPQAKRFELARRSQKLSEDMQDNMVRILAASERRINAGLQAGHA